MFCKIFIYVHKNLFAQQTWDLLEKLALIFLYNFHREHGLIKLIRKKLSPKINVKNIKNRVYVIYSDSGHLHNLLSTILNISRPFLFLNVIPCPHPPHLRWRLAICIQASSKEASSEIVNSLFALFIFNYRCTTTADQ